MKRAWMAGVVALTACAGQPAGPAGPTNPGGTLAMQCLGSLQRVHATNEYNGLSEADALAQAQRVSHAGGRVVARDAGCLPVPTNLVGGRVNLVASGGMVTWAGVERAFERG